MTDTSLRSQLFEVTGPELLTFGECVELIAERMGKNISFTSVNINEYLIMLNNQHIPSDFQWLIHELFTEVLDGRNAHVCDGVQQALGRPATPFIDYVTRTVKAGHWQ
ncbi:hypothetical protein [Marinomonas epiphytica]